MLLDSCIPVIPSADLEKSLRLLGRRPDGQIEFFATDDDGYEHCFGVATNNSGGG